MRYIVITGDIINSREKKFNVVEYRDKINHLNKQIENNLVKPFKMLKGDEIQGLLSIESDLFTIIRLLRCLFQPFALRVGVGIGSIYDEDKLSDFSTSWEINGEAFFNARKAIDIIKESENTKKDIKYTTYFIYEDNKLEEYINTLNSFCDEHILRWKKEVYKIVFLLEKGYNHGEIGKELNQKRENITQKIKRSNWYKINKSENIIRSIIRGK